MNRLTRIKQAVATAVIAGASVELASAAAIAVNFKGDTYSDTFGVDVTTTAFGIAPGGWVSGASTASTLDGGADSVISQGVSITWTFANDWAQAATYTGTTGESQVYFGYIDDGGTGANITISGLSSWLVSNSATAYSIQVLFSTGGGDSFLSTPLLTSAGGTNLGSFTSSVTGANAVLQGASNVISGLTSNTLFIDGPARSGGARGSIAGFIVTPIPEPSSLALIGVGALGFLRRRR